MTSGWPTPNRTDDKGPSTRSSGKERPPSDFDLPTLAGWATPRETDGEKNVRTTEGALREAERKGAQNDLGVTAMLAGWSSPRADSYNSRKPGTGGPVLPEQARLADSGLTPSGSPASTAKRGASQALNPTFVAWLMGYGIAHIMAAPEPLKKRRKD